MMDDLEAFRIPEPSKTETGGESRLSEGRHKTPELRRKRRFLRGPIDLPWLLKAASVAGKRPLELALALHFQAGLTRTKSMVRLTSKLKDEFGIPDRSARDALQKLESAGLVAVERRPGRCLTVSILDVD